MKSLLIVLGNQLFDKSNHPQEISDIFMCEDFDLCTYEKHHKKKISFFLTSMREYRDEMTDSGYKLHYKDCLLYTSPSPRDATLSRMPSSA